jgi:hypothetical protein
MIFFSPFSKVCGAAYGMGQRPFNYKVKKPFKVSLGMGRWQGGRETK